MLFLRLQCQLPMMNTLLASQWCEHERSLSPSEFVRED